MACSPHGRSGHTLLVVLESSTCYSNTPGRGRGGGGVSGEDREVRRHLLVDINIEVSLIHYLFSNQLLNHILQCDNSYKLGLREREGGRRERGRRERERVSVPYTRHVPQRFHHLLCTPSTDDLQWNVH